MYITTNSHGLLNLFMNVVDLLMMSSISQAPLSQTMGHSPRTAISTGESLFPAAFLGLLIVMILTNCCTRRLVVIIL